MFRKIGLSVCFIALAVALYAAPVQAASRVAYQPAIPHACPGIPGKSVSESKGCGSTGIHPNALCQGMTCNHQDPQQMQCSADAQTISTGSIELPQDVNRLYVQMRYSPSCQARWTRLWPANGVALVPGSVSNGCITITGTYYESICGVYGGAWTNMIYQPFSGSCTGAVEADATNIAGSGPPVYFSDDYC